MLVAMLLADAVGKAYSPDQPRDDHGRFAGGGSHEGDVFVSPNEGNLTFGQAVEALGSARHEQVKETVRGLATGKASVSDAIGAWADGAENSLVVRDTTQSVIDARKQSTILMGTSVPKKK